MQIPRLYAVYKEQGIIENFEQMLDNIFVPLFEVTKDPASHPQLHLFLKQARGRVKVTGLSHMYLLKQQQYCVFKVAWTGTIRHLERWTVLCTGFQVKMHMLANCAPVISLVP